jgi:hypothetical protein
MMTIDLTALETDNQGTWFRDYAINDAGRAYIAPAGLRMH